MTFGLIIVERASALRAVGYFATPSSRRVLRGALPLAITAGVGIRIALKLSWSEVILLGVAIGVVAVVAAVISQFLSRHFRQTWWFRSDSVHVQRGPVTRRIQWEAIRRWHLTPALESPGCYFLTLWHGYGESERASTIMTPSDVPREQIERVLQGYPRVV